MESAGSTTRWRGGGALRRAQSSAHTHAHAGTQTRHGEEGQLENARETVPGNGESTAGRKLKKEEQKRSTVLASTHAHAARHADTNTHTLTGREIKHSGAVGERQTAERRKAGEKTQEKVSQQLADRRTREGGAEESEKGKEGDGRPVEVLRRRCGVKAGKHKQEKRGEETQDEKDRRGKGAKHTGGSSQRKKCVEDEGQRVHESKERKNTREFRIRQNRSESGRTPARNRHSTISAVCGNQPATGKRAKPVRKQKQKKKNDAVKSQQSRCVPQNTEKGGKEEERWGEAVEK